MISIRASSPIYHHGIGCVTDGLTVFVILSSLSLFAYSTLLRLLLVRKNVWLTHRILMMCNLLVLIIKVIWWKWLAWIFFKNHLDWLLVLVLLEQILLLELALLHYLALRLGFSDTSRVVLDSFDQSQSFLLLKLVDVFELLLRIDLLREKNLLLNGFCHWVEVLAWLLGIGWVLGNHQ